MVQILVLFKTATQGKHEVLSNLPLDGWADLGPGEDAEHQLLSSHLCVVTHSCAFGRKMSHHA